MPDPQQHAVDYDALASQHGGSASASASSGVDYDALAQAHGGAAASPSSEGGFSAFAKEWWDRANPLTMAEGVVDSLKAKNLLAPITADPKFLTQAKEAWEQGDHLTAGRKMLSYLAMGMGHELDNQSDMLQRGEYARGAGAMAGTATQFLEPEVAGKAIVGARSMASAKLAPANPAIAEAVKFGQANGVPVDAATATDNAAVRAAQHVADRTIGGAQIAANAKQVQQEGLATLGEQLAAKAHPNATTLEQAGDATLAGVTGTLKSAAADADTAYGKLRTIEAQTPMPVSLSAVKGPLKPIYDGLLRERELNGVMMGDKARALNALDKIMNAPDTAPLSTVDAALSDLKSFTRSSLPEMRTAGQGAVAQAVKQLDAQVQGAAASAGPDALQALRDGRTATIAKYAASDVLDTLNAEPVKTVKGLTAPNDSAIAKLRAVAQQAPDALPQIGRSVLDGMLDKATEAGGFQHADKLYADWQKLGDQTKAMLFRDPAYVKDLDNFFLLAKKTAENANTSGTAHTIAVATQGGALLSGLWHMDPAQVGVAAGSVAASAGLSQFLHSSVGVKLLTQGLMLPPSAAAKAAWMGRVRQFATAQGIALGSQPQPASQPQ